MIKWGSLTLLYANKTNIKRLEVVNVFNVIDCNACLTAVRLSKRMRNDKESQFYPVIFLLLSSPCRAFLCHRVMSSIAVEVKTKGL